jgi:hypothetical protein
VVRELGFRVAVRMERKRKNTNRGGFGVVFIGSLAVVAARLVHIGGQDVASSSRCRAGARAEDETKTTTPFSCLSEADRYAALVLGCGLGQSWAAHGLHGRVMSGKPLLHFFCLLFSFLFSV